MVRRTSVGANRRPGSIATHVATHGTLLRVRGQKPTTTATLSGERVELLLADQERHTRRVTRLRSSRRSIRSTRTATAGACSDGDCRVATSDTATMTLQIQSSLTSIDCGVPNSQAPAEPLDRCVSGGNDLTPAIVRRRAGHSGPGSRNCLRRLVVLEPSRSS
jgi:hypothetical protein